MLRYDRLVAARSFRAAFSGWRDLATFLILLVIGVAFIRSWYMAASPTAAWVGAMGAGALSGMAAARAIEARLAFHAADSPFADEALTPSLVRWHAIAWHGVALMAVLLLAAVIGFASVPDTFAGFVAGAAAGHLSARLPLLRPFERNHAGRNRRGVVAVLAALAHAAGAAALHGALSDNAALIASAASASVLLLVLSPVDHAVVQFTARSGRSPLASIAQHIRPLLIFAAVDALLMSVLVSLAVAGLIVCAAMLVLLIVAARVLAYRVHSRRAADLLLTIGGGCAGLLLTIAPVLLPPALLAALAYLHRRASATTWLYA